MLFLSIRPQYADAIAQGKKTVELRRQRPRCQTGDWIAIYSASPKMQLEGVAKVGGVIDSSPIMIWQRFRADCGVSKAVFDKYFSGAKKAVAIQFSAYKPLKKPIPLSNLRDRWTGFSPPQSFRYLTDEELALVPEISRAVARIIPKAA